MPRRTADVPATDAMIAHWYRFFDFTQYEGETAFSVPQRFPKNGELLGDPTIRKGFERAVADGKCVIVRENQRYVYLQGPAGAAVSHSLTNH